MSNQNAPGVEFNEVDQSFFIRGASLTTGSMVGATQRGPLSTPTLVTSWPDFFRKFGDLLSNANGLLPYVAKRALDQGCQFYVVREDHKIASVHQSVAAFLNVNTRGGAASAAFAQSNVQPFSLAVGDVLTIQQGSSPVVNSAAVAASPAQLTTGVGTYVLHDGDYIDFRVGPASEPVQRVTFHSADFSSIGAATAEELSDVIARDLSGVEASLVTGAVQIDSDVKGTAGRLEVVGGSSGTVAAVGLSVAVVTGSGNVADLLHVTAAEVVALVAAVGFSIVVTSDLRVLVTAGDTVSNITITGAMRAKIGMPAGAQAPGSNTAVATIRFTASSPGAWGNNVVVQSALAINDPAGSWRADVLYLGARVESFEEMSMNPASARYFVKVMASSKYVAVTDLNEVTIASPGNRPADGAHQLATGLDAIDTMVDTDIVGDSAHRTGFYAMNPIRDAATLMAPGWTSLTVLNAGVAYCENRKDMVYIGMVPSGLEPNDAIDYRTAQNAFSSGSKPNSSFGALYFDWLIIDDPLSGLERAIPGEGEVLAAMNRSPKPWFAPAGSQRGKVQGIVRLAYASDDDQIGNMYAVGINPIYADPDSGPIIDGQKTLQVTPSATDRLNVRMLFIYLRKSITPSVKAIVFEPNDDTTWRTLKRLVNPFMDGVRDGRGVSDFKFKLDRTTTTDDDIDNNRLVANLFVKATRTAEFVQFNLISTSTGTDFQQV